MNTNKQANQVMKSRRATKNRKYTSKRDITEDTPLSTIEQEFVQKYLECGNATEALRQLAEVHPTLTKKSDASYRVVAGRMIKQVNIQAEIQRTLEKLKSDTVMSSREVMEYFTAVARGEIKDQFGLDAPLSERTKAAQEIAKRTVDIDLKMQLQNEKEGMPTINIKLIRE